MINDVLSNAEMEEFIGWYDRAHPSPAWADPAFFAATMLFIGLRAVEARNLRVEDCRVHPPIYVTVMAAKKKRGRRKLKRDDTVISRSADILPQFHTRYIAHLQGLRAAGRSWVFPSSQWPKQPISRTQGHYYWSRALAAAGLAHRGGHCGRRTFATYAPRIPFTLPDGRIAYMDPIALRDQLGHVDLKTTLQFYHQQQPGSRFPGAEAITWHESLVEGESS